jgi:hypothetical protein
MRHITQVIRLLPVLSILVALATPARAVTRHVPAEFTTIQAALDASTAGDEVLVAPGTYADSEVRILGGFPTRSCAFMVDGVVLRSESGPEVTTMAMEGAFGGPQGVVRFSGLPSTENAIEGFTVTGEQRGIWIVGVGKVRVENCVLRDIDAGPSTGAGIAANGDVDIIDCEFVNCIADAGGALIHSGGHLNLIRTTIRECGRKGAYLLGVAGGAGESALIEDCVFLDNWGISGGGLSISLYNLGVTVRRCWFEGNTATNAGGALGWGNFGPKLIEDCVFVSNGTVDSFGRGGAISIGGNGSCVIRGNTLHGNYQVDGTFGGSTLEKFTYTVFENNVVMASTGGTAFSGSGTLGTVCNVFWENPEGLGIPLGDTDREVDPHFCDPGNGDFTVEYGSPCVEPGSLGCGQIGAFGVGCGTVSVEPKSWGRIKGLYRKGEGR